MKTTLNNITVEKVNENSYNVYFGKGKGRVRGNVVSMGEAILFDKEFNNLEYRLINQNNTNKTGGAWFYKKSGNMFTSNHPFGVEYTFK